MNFIEKGSTQFEFTVKMHDNTFKKAIIVRYADQAVEIVGVFDHALKIKDEL